VRIDPSRCTGCRLCVQYCPARAIFIEDKKATIDESKCFECALCRRVGVCKVEAFVPAEELPWPRSIRSILSDPLTTFRETGVSGRGTEEMKTNDVTQRYGLGEYGLAVDVGRPNVGTSFREIERICVALAKVGVKFEEKNPVTFLMTDASKGTIRDDVKGEVVASAVIESKVPEGKLLEALDALKQVAREVDTVFSVGVISRCREDGTIPALELLSEGGWQVSTRGKTNVGLGRA